MMTTENCILDDKIFSLWDQFVAKSKAAAHAQSDEWAFCDDMSHESLSELSALLESELVTDDMVPQILCVKFVNGDIFHYHFGQCGCDEYDCCDCQSLASVDAKLQREMHRVSALSVVSDCYQLAYEDKLLVARLYHPNELNDHINALAQTPKGSTVKSVELPDSVFEME